MTASDESPGVSCAGTARASRTGRVNHAQERGACIGVVTNMIWQWHGLVPGDVTLALGSPAWD